jgi:hypothetical protein
MFCYLFPIFYLCGMMKRYVIISLIVFCCTTIGAQEKRTNITMPKTSATMPSQNIDSISATQRNMEANISTRYGEQLDSLNLPTMNSYGQVMPINMYPLYWGGWNEWDLHKGLNVSLGASVFAQFGKHAYSHSAGFTQNISAIYAMPITDKLSFAIGGYFNNVYWAHDSYRDAGLSGVLGYRFDNHWEAYLYGQKSLVNNHDIPYSLYDMNAIGDRIGAAVKYNFNPNFSVQVSVEHGWMPKQRGQYFDQYNYPVPSDK